MGVSNEYDHHRPKSGRAMAPPALPLPPALSKKDTEGIVRTNRMRSTENSVDVSQQSFQTCPKLSLVPRPQEGSGLGTSQGVQLDSHVLLELY